MIIKKYEKFTYSFQTITLHCQMSMSSPPLKLPKIVNVSRSTKNKDDIHNFSISKNIFINLKNKNKGKKEGSNGGSATPKLPKRGGGQATIARLSKKKNQTQDSTNLHLKFEGTLKLYIII